MRKVKKKKGLNLKEKLNFNKDKSNSNKVKKSKSSSNRNNNLKNEKTINENKTNELKSKNISHKNSKSKKHTNKKNNKKPKRSLWKKIVTFLLILGIIGVLAVASFFTYIVLTAPEFEESAFNVKDQTVIYDINGEIISKLGTEKRESVEYEDLPQVLIDAIIATEDSRFFQHNGVDLPRFIKATIQQLIGQDAGGASTLTMQVVKNNLTKKGAIEKNKIEQIVRKFQDVYLSVFKVEKEYVKEEIIELYVNNYGLGGSVYGVGEASKYYFGKSVSELTLPEASLIAGLFQAPSRHNPYNNIDSATNRRETVLKLMVRHGYITQEEADMANNISIESLLVGKKDNTIYQGFVDTVIEEVEDLTGQNPVHVPMKIYTTMEKSIQDGINSILENDASYWRNENTQAGIAIVNVKTGAIAAVGTGRNQTGSLQFNRATSAKRQPGSTAKPIFAYGPGLEYNNFSTYTLFVDEPWSYTDGPAINNWDGGFEGIITTRRALQVSRNIPALKAFQTVGPKNIQKFASSLGLNVSLNQNSDNYEVLDENGLDNTINEAYSIGGVAEGFTPLEMAAAYSGFASGGYYVDPYSVTKIEFRETGEIVEYKPTKERVMSESSAYLMNNILESAVNYGFSGGARVYGSHVAAKTGTSNYPDSVMKTYKLPGHAVNDLWTVAYTSQYSIAVWYGYDSVAKGYNTSGSYKDSLTADVMKYIPKDTVGWKQPSSVVAVQVEKETYPAKLPSEYTPSDMIITEYFKRGTQPTEISERYSQLNDITNSNVSVSGNTATITWDHKTPTALSDEYLDSYFSQSVFKNSKYDLIKKRKDYNTNTLGDIGFSIYKENSDGTLELITYTKETSYTYTASGSITLIIKTEHQKYKSNASNGVRINIKLSGTSSNENGSGNNGNNNQDEDNNSNNTLKISAILNGNTSITTNVGTYKESGIKSIYYGNTNITKTATIKYQIINNSTVTDFYSITELETAVNKLSAGNYAIKYIISYKGKELDKNRNITLR